LYKTDDWNDFYLTFHGVNGATFSFHDQAQIEMYFSEPGNLRPTVASFVSAWGTMPTTESRTIVVEAPGGDIVQSAPIICNRITIRGGHEEGVGVG
jgi:hypothetical protein